MIISMMDKRKYNPPCVDVVEIHIQNVILEGSPTEDVEEGGEHPWS